VIAPRRSMARLLGPLGLSLCAMALSWCLVASPAAAAAPAKPAFRITSAISPSHLLPGDESGNAIYAVRVLNIGGKSTNGSRILVSDELPAGIVNDPFGEGEVHALQMEINETEAGSIPCHEGAISSCEVFAPLPPGGTLVMAIPVDISPGAANPAVNRATVSGGGAEEASTVESAPVAEDQVPFGFQSLSNFLTDADGKSSSQAGAHPYSYTVHFQLTQQGVRDSRSKVTRNPQVIVAKLPKGLVVNPNATAARCSEAQFEASEETECPDGSAIGVAHASVNFYGFAQEVVSPVYNLDPPPGAAAAFGIAPAGFPLFIHILGHVDASGNYVLTASAKDLPQLAQASGLDIELWGNPTDPSHDARRGSCAYVTFSEPCTTEFTDSAQLTTPSACGQPSPLTVNVTPYQEPADILEGAAPLTGPEGSAIGFSGCNKLKFSPTISSQATTNLADSPTGLEFNLHQPQNNSFGGLATAALKDATVTLPAGMTLNPSAANGLAACDNAQIGYLAGQSGVHFSEEPQSCPDAAKVGTLEVSTPLLSHKLPGAIYVATPYENPFGSLLAIYLAVEDEQSGTIAKLAGKVVPDPASGQLTATFTENPELPIEDIDLHFFQGPAAALKTPSTCGSYAATSELTPWSSPEGATADPSSAPFAISAVPGAAGCPTTEAQLPFAQAFEAGTVDPKAATYSPFVLKLRREDGSQQISAIDTTLPEGLVGRLAGVPYCPQDAIAAAAGKTGRAEQASPSCPAASQVGSVTVGAGAGPAPYYAPGKVYLAGPYKGAPLSLAVITPAVAGPFDLGNVVTRVALNVGLFSAQIHAVSDPLPTILQGIPLDVRSIALTLDKPNFTLNPTSCQAMALLGSSTSTLGATDALYQRFQVGGCQSLKFKPKLALSVKGPTKRNGHPALKAVVTFPKGQSSANIATAQVGLPHSEFLDQANIKTVCKQAQLAAGTCPKGSIYGQAKAWTPLLEKPLTGPVYLGVGFGHKLPDLVADLNGQIRILVHGRVDTDKQEGLRNTFEMVPDAPVSRFVLEMNGGKKKGLIVNSTNICKGTHEAEARFTAQNEAVASFQAPIANSCGKKK
jgi:hypothetical protein